MTISGVDVSVYQGVPGAWTGAAGSFSFAAVKFTELEADGTRYVDPDAGADWSWLKAHGKYRIAYLFGHPSVSAADTVSFFASEVAKSGLEDADAIAVDLETTDGLAAAKVASWADTVLGDLHTRYGRPPLLYTYLDFAREGNCAGLGGYPLWISDPSSAAGSPTVPAPWKDWAIHQYSITGAIDRNAAHYASVAAMRAALGKKTTAAAILEDPMLVLNGANVDTPVALPAGAKAVQFAAVNETTVNIQFSGHGVQEGIKLSWGHGKSFDVPSDTHTLRVYRPADGSPDVPVSIAIS
jgi:lysozyme